ncbi:MAG: bifunctional riboflavin kinase/FAD synthetase [Planctomycetia bacterium]|nr:bifunctional riboflavin kinase/FAD synthetase [Planctomycetia bacterium]
MKLLRNLDELSTDLRGGAVSVGNFDGVHRGHARLAQNLREQAQRLGGPAVVFTFDPHPAWILRPRSAPMPLTWLDRKVQLLAELGIDAVVAYPTDEALLGLTAREFFDRILCDALGARALIEGANFCFGHDRTGTIDVLAQFAAEAGIALDVVDPVLLDGEVVSSSRVRRLVSTGKVDEAGRLLTRPYRIRGLVRHGAARGAKLGFPTANVDGVDTLVPGPGVYAGRAIVGTEAWPAAINIGPNPTFGEQAVKIEVHLIGFHGNLYGTLLEVDFLAPLREVKKFDGVEVLKAQLQRDIARTKELVAAAADRFATPLDDTAR